MRREVSSGVAEKVRKMDWWKVSPTVTWPTDNANLSFVDSTTERVKETSWSVLSEVLRRVKSVTCGSNDGLECCAAVFSIAVRSVADEGWEGTSQREMPVKHRAPFREIVSTRHRPTA